MQFFCYLHIKISLPEYFLLLFYEKRVKKRRGYSKMYKYARTTTAGATISRPRADNIRPYNGQLYFDA